MGENKVPEEPVTSSEDEEMSGEEEDEAVEQSDDEAVEQSNDEDDDQGDEDGDEEDMDDDDDDDSDEAADEEEEADDEDIPDDETPADPKDEKSGWADAMAKVLRTNKDVEDTGKLLLSKAKKDYERKSKEGEEGADNENGTKKKEVSKTSLKLRLKRKELDSISRVKPTVLDRNREKVYTKLATKGVVQLFNAVRDHQKNIKTQLGQVGKSIRKREKVFKTLDREEFLNVLSGSKKAATVGRSKNFEVKKTEIKNEDSSETWSVLRDDYMMGAKMKDWDKEGDSD